MYVYLSQQVAEIVCRYELLAIFGRINPYPWENKTPSICSSDKCVASRLSELVLRCSSVIIRAAPKPVHENQVALSLLFNSMALAGPLTDKHEEQIVHALSGTCLGTTYHCGRKFDKSKPAYYK